MNAAIQKLASLLQTDSGVVQRLQAGMTAATGETHVMERIVQENQERVRADLEKLELRPDASAEEVYGALLKKVLATGEALFSYLGDPATSNETGCQTIAKTAEEIVGHPRGVFLKRKRAEEFLRNTPPKNLLKLLGYKSIDDALKKEDFFEVFSSIRFAEDPQWLNEIFFKQYESLEPEDFEERKIEVIVLSEHWRKIGEKFAGKKLHHISHLKELGVIFVIPTGGDVLSLPEIGATVGLPEEAVGAASTLEIFTLVLHYLYEIPFYSRLFRAYSQEPDFTHRFISALRGDVLGTLPPSVSGGVQWRVIQQYLAKKNPNDPRLFEPHVNPEALHWTRAERALERFGKEHPELRLAFWSETDFVGEYFKSQKGTGKKVFLSLDLIDNLISLVQGSTLAAKYLYHQREALWNRVFEAYVGGEEKMEEAMVENLHRGYIEF